MEDGGNGRLVHVGPGVAARGALNDERRARKRALEAAADGVEEGDRGARLARAGPTTAPLETAGIGARPVGPGVAMTTGASSSRKASAMWGNVA